MITPEAVEQAIRPETALVSVMAANNEVGTLNPLAEIADVCRAHAVPFHSDAVQAAPYLPLNLRKLGVDLLALGAHKFHGPKVSGLYVRKGTALLPAQTGGGRSTGCGQARRTCPISSAWRRPSANHIRTRSAGCPRATAAGPDHRPGPGGNPDARLTGHPTCACPPCQFCLQGYGWQPAPDLLDAAGFACSSGSACKTGNPEPSEVMAAIGLPPQWAWVPCG